MTLAERIFSRVQNGANGVLFWWGVACRAEYVAKRLTYRFPDGSLIIRDNADTDHETVTADWPIEKPGAPPPARG